MNKFEARDRVIEIDDEIQKLQVERAKLIKISGIVRRPLTLSALEEGIYDAIKNSPGTYRHDGSEMFSNALTRMRRNGWIENRGGRANPQWFITGIEPHRDFRRKSLAG